MRIILMALAPKHTRSSIAAQISAWTSQFRLQKSLPESHFDCTVAHTRITEIVGVNDWYDVTPHLRSGSGGSGAGLPSYRF